MDVNKDFPRFGGEKVDRPFKGKTLPPSALATNSVQKIVTSLFMGTLKNQTKRQELELEDLATLKVAQQKADKKIQTAWLSALSFQKRV